MLNGGVNKMAIKEEIKVLLAQENKTMTYVAEKFNTSVQNISNKLRGKTIRFEEVRKMADILGYDIKFEKRH
jgi:transcriptional regulator with XRE-family HTH domain